MLCLGLLVGCTESESPILPGADEMAAADSAIAMLGEIEDSTFMNAFASLPDRTFRRYERIEQFGRDGRRIAFEEHLERRSPQELRITRSDSSGAFDFGYLDRFTDPPEGEMLPADMPAYILPDDPPYALPRNREAFSYRHVADTSLHGRPVRLLQIRARPETGDAQSIRRADLYVDAANRLMGAYVERVHTAIWFEERTTVFMSVDQLASGAWVPKQTRFETFITAPFRPAQRFRSVSSYFGFGGMESVAGATQRRDREKASSSDSYLSRPESSS